MDIMMPIVDGMEALRAIRVAGKHQTAIKSLGKMYRDVKGVSGATVLGDGTVARLQTGKNKMGGIQFFI